MAAPNSWTRERHNLTLKHLSRAATMIAREAVPGRGLELADTGCVGLSLRVGKRSASWYLRMDSRTIRLGAMESLTVAEARVAADRIRLRVHDGIAPEDSQSDLQIFHRAVGAGHRLDDAADAAFPVIIEAPTVAERRRFGPWEWNDLVELHLEAKGPTQKPAWRVQYERHLRRSAEGAMATKLIKHVKLDDLVAVRDRVAEQRTQSAAADTVEAVKAALDWAWEHHGPRAGLAGVDFPWWRTRLNVEWASTPREHTPSLEELARTLLLAERHKALGGTGKETGDTVLAALWATVLTGQRVGSLCGTLRATTRPWPERPGWEIWTWTATEMKGGGGLKAPHGVPVPPRALQALSWFDLDRSSPYLFPSQDPGTPVRPNAMTQLFTRLQGKAKSARKDGLTVRPEGDLFAAHGIRPWWRHDVRRTLGSYLDMERLGGAGSAILAHRRTMAKGERPEERELAQAITIKHYIRSQRLDLKAEGMEAWTSAVLDAYEGEKAAFDALQAVSRP